MRLALTSLLLTVALALGACKTTPTAIRSATRLSVAVALVQAEADISDAESVRDIAAGVRLAVAGDTDYSTTVIRAVLTEAIKDGFSGKQEVIYLLVAEEAISLIVEGLLDYEPIEIPEQERAFIDAAAAGVEQGAEIYIAASQP